MRVPTAPTLDAQFVLSTRGSLQLCIDGYTFTRHIVKEDTIYWRCTQARALCCQARHRQRRSTGVLEVVWAQHNHGILKRRKRGILRDILLKREQRNQQSAMINIPKLSEVKYPPVNIPVPEAIFGMD